MDDITTRNKKPSFREQFLELVCRFDQHIVVLFALQITLIVILIPSFLYISTDSPSYVVLQIDVIILTITTSLTVLSLYACKNWQS